LTPPGRSSRVEPNLDLFLGVVQNRDRVTVRDTNNLSRERFEHFLAENQFAPLQFLDFAKSQQFGRASLVYNYLKPPKKRELGLSIKHPDLYARSLNKEAIRRISEWLAG
jgi:hypothetical protein